MPDYERMYFDTVRKLEVVLTILSRIIKEGKDEFIDAYLAAEKPEK